MSDESYQPDKVGDMNPLSDLAGNRCCVCGCRVWGKNNSVPLYYCPDCHKEWFADIKNKKNWIHYLYQQENNRRKRRANRLKEGYAENYLTENILTG